MPLRFLLTLVFVIAAEIYSFVLVRSITRSMPAGWRLGIIIFYVCITLLAWSSLFFFRRIDWAHLPHGARNIYIAFTIGFFVGKLLILAVMLIDDIRRIFLWLILKYFPATDTAFGSKVGDGITRSVFLKRLALILGGVAIGGFLYGVTNRYRYQVRRVKLSFPHLPAAFKGLKMVQISDVHSGSFDNEAAVQHGVDMILQEKPDIIFFTGDLVNNKAEEIKPYMPVFSKLSAPLGVFSTLGNHDYGDYVQWESQQAKQANLEELKSIHGRMGWRLLMNEHVILEKGDDKIAVLGIENWSAKANFPKYGDMGSACAGLPEKQIPFKILLSHDPSHFDAQVTTQHQDIDLTLSGHTHGMQFGVEIPGFKWSPVKYVYKKWSGLYQVGAQYLYVNRGYGFLGYPGRLGILPEITVIELA
ncbi:MAG TPA: metallophosphoesterase [Flavipsychrobacter sp.]|nr:metallophosphoesterase [Flavipsychrobacter sp.]